MYIEKLFIKYIFYFYLYIIYLYFLKIISNIYIHINYIYICYRLPLPGSIMSWKGVPHHEEVYDDPSQHDGRVRSFKHERGNWATLIYINCKYLKR